MTASEFLAAVQRGDVVDALVDCPFGYQSQYANGGFAFHFTSGPWKGQRAVGATLGEAVKNACRTTRIATTDSSSEATP